MDELLTSLKHFRAEGTATDDSMHEVRARLLQEIERTPPPSAHGRRTMRARHTVSIVLAAALSLAMLMAVVVPGVLGGNGSSASATLRDLGRVAARQAFEPLGAGRYLYTKTVAVWQWCTVDGCEPRAVTRETWKAPDGSGVLRQTYRDLDGTLLERWNEAFEAGGLHLEDTANLPTQVDSLTAYVEDRASQASDVPLHEEMFVVIGDLLREAHASPELRAALYEVAASLPGAELIGATTDERGRPGIGVGYRDDDGMDMLIFDPETAAVLGERSFGPDGAVTGWSVILRSEVVDRAPTDEAELVGQAVGHPTDTEG